MPGDRDTRTTPLFGMRRPFISEMQPPTEHAGPAWWFGFHRNQLLLEIDEDRAHVPCRDSFADLGVRTGSRHYLGRYNGLPCYAVDVLDRSIPDGLTFKDLRQVYGTVDDDLFVLGGRAVQIVEWDRTHQHCGRCGAKTQIKESERARECPECKLLNFPRLSPAIIVAVERSHELLLARSPHFPPKLYSVLAGFVEPGETVEEAVIREVEEEVGILVENVRYYASQPWPFPNSLMLGFVAQYASGTLTLNDHEIEEAAWFTADSLPSIPGRISISRRLIDQFVDKQRAGT